MSEPVATGFRAKVLLGVFAAVAGLGAVAWARQSTLEAEVAPLIGRHALENSSPGVEVASGVVVTRDALLFGTPHAKVEIFVRDKDGGKNAKFAGIEYNYELENGQWRLVDSGGCSGPECAIRGNEAFRRGRGVTSVTSTTPDSITTEPVTR